jgi:hypothetical protein
MVVLLEKLKMLKGRSLDELRVRSVQALTAFSEQYAWAEQARLPQDADLMRSLNGACEQNHIKDTIGLLDYFRRRRSPAFFAAFDDRAATLAELRRRWPDREAAVIAEAERIAQGRFRLLGFDDLNFGTPVDWHLEPVAGKRAPLQHWSRINYLDARDVGDKKIIWELNRCQHFAPLGQAYWCTGDERYAEIFIAHLTGWMDANPPKLGINWASSLEVSFRAISWLWGLHFFRESPRLTAEVFSRALKYLYLHARHLETYLSTYFSPNTHLTGEALGLFYLGLMLPEFHRAGRWRALGWKTLIDELDRHVRSDGVYFEQASYYHRYTTDFYTHLLALMRRNGWPRETYLEEKLTALLDHLMHLIRPDGTAPLVGDDDGGRLIKVDGRQTGDFRAALATGAALFGRGDYKHVAGEAAEETLWLLGPEGVREFDRAHSGAPAHLSLAFTDGGYYLLRDGWARQSNYLLIDCGPHGALSCGHAHADALSFELAAGGASWLVDPGTFTYTGDAGLRDEFRSTSAHNTATVDGQSQSVPAGPFSWSQVARVSARQFITGKRFDYFAGEHDGYQRLADPVTHERAVFFVKSEEGQDMPGYVVVRDSFVAHAAHSYALHYHFDSDCRILAASGDWLRAARTDGDELLLCWRGTAELRARIVEGTISRCYGQQQAAPVVICEAEAAEAAEPKGPQSFITCLLPVPAGRAEPAAEFVPGQANTTSDGCLRVRSGRAADVVLINMTGGGDSRVETDGLAACGELAWARMVDGRVVSLGLVCGRSLECVDGFGFYAPAVARHCVIERHEGDIEITLEGAQCFHLVLAEPAASVIINGARLGISPDWRRAGFVQGRAGWRLSELDC